jgi:hypothetical protein
MEIMFYLIDFLYPFSFFVFSSLESILWVMQEIGLLLDIAWFTLQALIRSPRENGLK